MLWHVLMNPEDLTSDPYSITHMNKTFLSWLLNIATKEFRISRGGHLPLYVNPKGYEVAEHIVTKTEVNTRILTTFKNEKSIWSINPGEMFETSMFVPLRILVDLVKRQVYQGSYKSGKFVVIPSTSPCIVICFILAVDKLTKVLMNNLREFFK